MTIQPIYINFATYPIVKSVEFELERFLSKEIPSFHGCTSINYTNSDCEVKRLRVRSRKRRTRQNKSPGCKDIIRKVSRSVRLRILCHRLSVLRRLTIFFQLLQPNSLVRKLIPRIHHGCLNL